MQLYQWILKGNELKSLKFIHDKLVNTPGMGRNSLSLTRGICLGSVISIGVKSD